MTVMAAKVRVYLHVASDCVNSVAGCCLYAASTGSAYSLPPAVAGKDSGPLPANRGVIPGTLADSVDSFIVCA